MADVELQSLELKIIGDANGAKAGLDALITTLDTLKTKTKGGCGLSTIATNVGKLATEAGKLNGSEGAKLESLAKGLSALANLGNLKLSPSIANQISAMAEATKKLDGVDYTKLSGLVTAVQPLESLGKSNLGSILAQIKKLPEVMTELSKVNLVDFGAKVTQLAKSLKPLADEMQKISAGFSTFPTKIQKFTTASSKIPSANNASAQSFAKLGAKIVAAWYTLKRVSSVIASWITKSNDYVENLNLFTVAMGEYAGEAQKYAEQVGELMGIDPSAWMRNQGVFMTLATGFGVAGDRAATMSQQLTQLGYDISSFYNISIEDAMQRLQSGLSGELEPLRRLGYDLSQAKLEAIALSKGIDKSVSSMTQAEKAELRYYAIMTQVTQAQGDMSRTLDAPANQLRIFKAQAEQAARALGNIFIPALNAILPYAIAATKVLRIVADAVAALFGFTLPEIDYSEVGNVGNNTADGFEDANKEVAKMKRMLLGIDELNVLSDNSSSSGTDLGGTGFDFELPTYDFIGEATTNRVNEIVESMKEWLGIGDDITGWADLMETRFGTILKLATAVGIAISAWKVGTGIVSFVNLLKSSAIVKFISDIGFAIGAVVTGAGTVGEAITFAFGGAAGIISGITLAISGLIGYISNLVNMIREGESVSNILGTALGGLATAAGGFLIAIGAGATVATGGIVAAVIAAIAAVGMLTAIIINHWDEIKAAIGTAWTWLYDNVLAPVGEWFAGAANWFYLNVITPIVNFFAPVVDAIVEMAVLIYNRVKEIVTGIGEAIGTIISKVAEIALKIGEIFVALGVAAYTYIIEPFINWIVGAATWVYNTFISPIINFFVELGKSAYKYIVKPIYDKVIWLRDKAIELFKKIGTSVVDFISNLLKSTINGMLDIIERKINSFIRLLNGAIDLINKIPGVSITKVTEISIPRLAEGGMVDQGQMFIAREAGPELVGNIGNRAAVANNDQIVSAVSKGVYQAVVQAMGQSGNQTVEAKVNDKVLFEVVVNRNRQETMRTGYNPLLGGA